MSEKELNIEKFYKNYFCIDKKDIKISLELLLKIKNAGISTEQFLDYLCQKHGFLLHGSIHEIKNGKIKLNYNKIFASDRAVVAIERSLYSNVGVNLQYPYFINEENPFVLKIHTKSDGKFIKKDKGFIYILDRNGFKNEPEGSWQFIKESREVNFIAVIETENNDFTYPVEFFNDFDEELLPN